MQNCRHCDHTEERHFTSNDGLTNGCAECYQSLGMIDAQQCEGFTAFCTMYSCNEYHY